MSLTKNSTCNGKLILRDDQSKDLLGNWQMQVRGVMRQKKVLLFVEREERMIDPVTGAFIEEVGKLKAPEPMTVRNSKGWKAWKDKRDEAAAVIVEHIDPDQYMHIKGIDDDPLAMWEALASYHTIKGLGSIVSPIILKLNGDPMVSDIDYVTAQPVKFEKTYGKGQLESVMSGERLGSSDTSAMAACACRPVSEITCFRYGKRGHIQAHCQEPVPAPAAAATTLVAMSSPPAVGELTQYYAM
ncbi:hypothetical protein DFJ43DRAFT_1156787 [Lentinula guzmanii]|uniref:Uncharacterized protein n=1 Tax=Lentinula guzmanii TaxID=2804957 RepID=A0AA38JCE1_9AGAR|nr:hypothetical protein DFJ43DRAFT_1156787 [Lentinula guzmanii]